jgi:nitroreductase
MDLLEAMRTTFACREFTDRGVDDATLFRVLDAARFAPSGGNRQGWRVIVIRDAALRQRFSELSAPVMQRYVAQMMAGESPYNTIVPSKVTDEAVTATPVPDGVVASITAAPVLLLVGVDLRVVTSFDRALDRIGLVSGGSIYPFAWNILLAARNEGLAGVLTTFLAPSEPEVQKLVGWPASIAIAGAVPLGYPVKQLTRLKRNPVADFARIGHWDGPPLTE